MTAQEEYNDVCSHLIPKQFQFACVKGLKVNTSGITRMPGAIQEALYTTMRAKPLASYAFFAPAGFSKTTCSWALYREALAANMSQRFKTGQSEINVHLDRWTPNYDPSCFVWHKSTPDLLQELFARMENDNAPLATISTEKIEKAVKKNFVPRVFLEEIDKIKVTDYSTNVLYRIIDALYRNQGQLVLDTNFSKAQFREVFGDPIARRVRDMCDADFLSHADPTRVEAAGGMWEIGF
jgi:hypothetical protein